MSTVQKPGTFNTSLSQNTLHQSARFGANRNRAYNTADTYHQFTDLLNRLEEDIKSDEFSVIERTARGYLPGIETNEAKLLLPGEKYYEFGATNHCRNGLAYNAGLTRKINGRQVGIFLDSGFLTSPPSIIYTNEPSNWFKRLLKKGSPQIVEDDRELLTERANNIFHSLVERIKAISLTAVPDLKDYVRKLAKEQKKTVPHLQNGTLIY